MEKALQAGVEDAHEGLSGLTSSPPTEGPRVLTWYLFAHSRPFPAISIKNSVAYGHLTALSR